MCKGKFSAGLILLAFKSKKKKVKKDIHAQLEETIADRKRILRQWERLFLSKPVVVKKDIHTELQDTIADLKRERNHWMVNKKAA